MGLDIRTPIGLMFGLFGLLLVGYGLLTSGSDIYQRSLGLNVKPQFPPGRSPRWIPSTPGRERQNPQSFLWEA